MALLLKRNEKELVFGLLVKDYPTLAVSLIERAKLVVENNADHYPVNRIIQEFCRIYGITPEELQQHSKCQNSTSRALRQKITAIVVNIHHREIILQINKTKLKRRLRAELSRELDICPNSISRYLHEVSAHYKIYKTFRAEIDDLSEQIKAALNVQE